MSEFFEMGGYGTFIWTSYGVSAVFLMVLLGLSLRRLRRVERDLKPLEENRRALRKSSVKEEATS